MTSVGRGIRRALGVPLAVLMVAPGVAMSILDRGEFEHQLAIEQRGHDPSDSPSRHDHNLCLQVRANHPVPTFGAGCAPTAEVVWFLEPHAAPAGFPHATRVTHRPRAPPAV
jgi:hypothetical protein